MSLKPGDRVLVTDSLDDGLSGGYYVERVSDSGRNVFLSKSKGGRWSACVGVGRCKLIDKGEEHDSETKP